MASTPFTDTLTNLRRSVVALQELLHEESGPFSESELQAASTVGTLCRTFLNELYSNHPQATAQEAMEDELFFNITMDDILGAANDLANKMEAESSC